MNKISDFTVPDRGRFIRSGFSATNLKHDIDNPLQSHFLAVGRGENPGNTVPVQLVDFMRNDNTATPTEYPDIAAAKFLKHIQDVFEILDMAALI